MRLEALRSKAVSSFFRDYYFLGLAAAIGASIAGAGLFLGRLVRPRSRSQETNEVYEAGAHPAESSENQGQLLPPNQRYYKIALLFLIFDVEMAFIAPWAVQAESLGSLGLVEVAVFVAILLLGLVYAWKKGDLEWR